MKRKIATALRSDMSDEREKNGSRDPREPREAATTDLLLRGELRFLAATALGDEGSAFRERSIFRAGRGGAQALRRMQRGGASIRVRPLHQFARSARAT